MNNHKTLFVVIALLLGVAAIFIVFQPQLSTTTNQIAASKTIVPLVPIEQEPMDVEVPPLDKTLPKAKPEPHQPEHVTPDDPDESDDSPVLIADHQVENDEPIAKSPSDMRLHDLATKIEDVDLEISIGYAARTRWLASLGSYDTWTPDEKQKYAAGNVKAKQLELQRDRLLKQYEQLSKNRKTR